MTALQESWQQQKRQRQQATIARRQQVQSMLIGFQRSRHAQLAEQRADLQAFHQNLQRQTATDLAAIASARAVLAQQIVLDLQRDRLRMSQAVGLLRQELQQQVRSLQLDTHTWLSTRQQQRQQMHQQQMQDLRTDVELLQLQVQHHITQVATLRPVRAAKVQHKLEQARTQRQRDVAGLFEQLAAFRHELRQYRAALAQEVWGVADLPAIELSKPEPLPAVAIEPAVPMLVESAVKSAVESMKSAAEPAPSIEPTAPVAPALEDPWLEADQPTRSLLESEERVHCYLREQQGARLTEIETLGLTRFQIVDALRSLIKKGLVQQRDRVYLAQE